MMQPITIDPDIRAQIEAEVREKIAKEENFIKLKNEEIIAVNKRPIRSQEERLQNMSAVSAIETEKKEHVIELNKYKIYRIKLEDDIEMLNMKLVFLTNENVQ